MRKCALVLAVVTAYLLCGCTQTMNVKITVLENANNGNPTQIYFVFGKDKNLPKEVEIKDKFMARYANVAPAGSEEKIEFRLDSLKVGKEAIINKEFLDNIQFFDEKSEDFLVVRCVVPSQVENYEFIISLLEEGYWFSRPYPKCRVFVHNGNLEEISQWKYLQITCEKYKTIIEEQK